MSDEKHETELERAIREADEAEARLRKLKESLIPRDRAAALRVLCDAELRALTMRELAKFQERLIAARTGEERAQLLKDFQAAMIEGTHRVEAAMLEQTKAWTLAGLEDREREGL